MNKVFRFLALIATVVLIVSPVLANTGGIKVDNDGLCEESNREENALPVACPGVIWLNLQQDSPGTYTCQICNKGVCDSCRNFTNNWFSCGDGYYNAGFETPLTEGTYTLSLSDGSGKNVSRDSFRVSFDVFCD